MCSPGLSQDQDEEIGFIDSISGTPLPNSLVNEVRNTSRSSFKIALNTYSSAVYSCTTLDLDPTYYWNIIVPNDAMFIDLRVSYWNAPALGSTIQLHDNIYRFEIIDKTFHFDLNAKNEEDVQLTIMRVNPSITPSFQDQILFQEILPISKGRGSLSKPVKYCMPGTYTVSVKSGNQFRAISLNYHPTIHESSVSNS